MEDIILASIAIVVVLIIIGGIIKEGSKK